MDVIAVLILYSYFLKHYLNYTKGGMCLVSEYLLIHSYVIDFHNILRKIRVNGTS